MRPPLVHPSATHHGLARVNTIVTAVISPRGRYSLAATAGRFTDSTWRRRPTGEIEVVFAVGDALAHAYLAQRSNGEIVAAIDADDVPGALTTLRFMLAVDDDTAEFTTAFRDDPLLAPCMARARGARPMRTATVGHSVLKAVTGQLITAREALLIERRILARIGRQHQGLAVPPDQTALASLPAAEYVACGLHPKRASALTRLLRHIDLEALHHETRDGLIGRLGRERMIGPWSIGVIALMGLGRYDIGLVGDLNLIRLTANVLGRPATADDSAELLERYAPWAGLASLLLMRHPHAHDRRYPRADGGPERGTPPPRRTRSA